MITAGEGNSPLLIGGWARLSVLQAERGVRTDYLHRAERLWDHATKRGAQVAGPHLLLSALEMHRATGQPAYLNSARQAAEALLAQQATAGRARGAFGTFGALPAAAQRRFFSPTGLMRVFSSSGFPLEDAGRAWGLTGRSALGG